MIFRTINESTARARKRLNTIPILAYGICLIAVGFAMYLFGIVLSLPRIVLGLGGIYRDINEWIVWYSGMPVFFGLAMALFDLFALLPTKRRGPRGELAPVANRGVTVALTAYDDEASIGAAVRDFAAHPAVVRVIVVDNNSRDATATRAREAGAIVVTETRQGYGYSVYRCLSEAIAYSDTELTLLCEGDRTFRAHDIDKFLAYIPHADIVNGTRISEQLRAYETQLSTFMFYGNLFVAKLLEAKHLGRGTFTDVGTTYKLCRNAALSRLLPHLNPAINLEFNAHLLDTALAEEIRLVECPITFFPRVGVSKGGNVNNRRAFSVGARMIGGLLLGWKRREA